MSVQSTALEWIEKRKGTIQKLRDLADDIDKHTKNGRIAHVTGLSGSIVAALITGGCLIAIPFTGGLSAIGAGVAAGIGIAGGGVSLGTALVKHLLEKGIIKEVQQAIDEDRQLTKTFMESISQVLKDPTTYLSGSRKMLSVAKFAAEIADVADDAVKAAGVAARVSKVLGIVGAALSIAILPFDIYDLVKTSIDIHKKSLSETADKVRSIATELEEDLRNVRDKYRNNFGDITD
ncbi:hypothetical protein FSP39_018600 [Pinctada imbricata]|uniref:Uncharacterized protein n=1 Tax=Pinctada imbricata TaxID=66713 RepID=A0AA89C468_PINIB|nr:hypothetical protein FSP39_018600 [Pinctada imbricata]